MEADAPARPLDRRSVAFIFLFYLIAAVIFTWPLVLHPADSLAAREGPGDPYLNLWILGWDLRMISTDPASLIDGRVFDANIFHPVRQSLTFSDHLILQALIVWPLYALTGDVVLCYNAVFFFSLVAAALAMFAFVSLVVASRSGAMAAGLIWGFWPYHFLHLTHLQLQSLYFLPLAFLFLYRLTMNARWKDACALGVVAALQAISSGYYGVIGAMALAVAAPFFMIGGRLPWKVTLQLAVAGVIGAVLILPVVWPYMQTQLREGFGRTLVEASRHAAKPSDYLAAPDMNAVYGSTGWLGVSGVTEEALFPGFVSVILAGIALTELRRKASRTVIIAMVAVGTLGFLLSLGPDGVRLLYATLHRVMLGFQSIRAPARFAVLLVFAIAVMAAFGVRVIETRSGRRYAPLAVILLLTLEYLNAPIAYAAAPARQTLAGAWLRNAPQAGAVLYLPLYLNFENTPYMVHSLEHGRPIVNGYSGHRPSFYSAIVETIGSFPSADSLRMLHGMDVRYVVSPAAVEVASWPLSQKASFTEEFPGFPDGGVIYEIVWTPEADQALAPSVVLPPEPGPIPFEVGERATYSVSWGVGSGLTAGTAVLAVEDGQAAATPAPYRFVVTATTAEWVANFFEARDRFETLATDDLKPLVHTRLLEEGRRRVSLRVDYDHQRHVVRRTGGPGQTDLPLPMTPGSRDPITLFYYARTLSLKSGEKLRFPLNEAGRSSVIELESRGEEDIEYQGRPTRALRIEPRLLQQLQNRAPVQMTIWLSTDERRIPLVVEISAGFGPVRAVLSDYRRGAVPERSR